jgi:hypothetical protein
MMGSRFSKGRVHTGQRMDAPAGERSSGLITLTAVARGGADRVRQVARHMAGE